MVPPGLGRYLHLWDVGSDNLTIESEGSVATESATWSDVKALYSR